MNTKHKIARILYVVGLIALPIPYLWPIDAKVEGLGAVFLFFGVAHDISFLRSYFGNFFSSFIITKK